ncbi:MAG: cation diffusion facilitator family transporter [Nitrospiria bacterium]
MNIPNKGNEGTLHLHEPACRLDLCHHDDSESSIAPIIHQGKFYWAIGLTAVVMGVEIVGGFLTNSLALISDGGHMLTHLFALLISFLAILFSAKPATLRRSYGFYRLEILAALFNGCFLLIITFWILYEAVQRFYIPETVASQTMLVIALVGLVTNLVTAMLLSGSERNDINTQSAILHLAGDTLASVGVVLGAAIIAYTEWWWIDPVLGILISILILYWAYGLIRDAIDILLEATPKEIDPSSVMDAVKVFDEVRDIHDVHVWTLTSGMYALSAHVSVQDMPLKDTATLLKKINFLLCQRFKIGHAAIQFESAEKPPKMIEARHTISPRRWTSLKK